MSGKAHELSGLHTVRCWRGRPVKTLLEFEAGGGLVKRQKKRADPWWSSDLKEGYDLCWKTARCYSWHDKERRTEKRTEKSHAKEDMKIYCVVYGHSDFSLNVQEGKKAPKLRKTHGNNVECR